MLSKRLRLVEDGCYVVQKSPKKGAILGIFLTSREAEKFIDTVWLDDTGLPLAYVQVHPLGE